MNRYCLDTSAYSFFQRGDPAVVSRLDSADWIGVSSVVLGELWIGFLKGRRLDHNQDQLSKFLANPVVEELNIDSKVARIFAEITLDLRAVGTPVPANDIWIAASAAGAGASVLTYDEHFRQIQRVGSIILPVS